MAKSITPNLKVYRRNVKIIDIYSLQKSTRVYKAQQGTQFQLEVQLEDGSFVRVPFNGDKKSTQEEQQALIGQYVCSGYELYKGQVVFNLKVGKDLELVENEGEV